MTRDEFKTLVKGMKAVYADPKFIADADAFNIWFNLLKDLDYHTVSTAIQKHMLTCKFAPTVSEIREQCASLTKQEELTDMEAWSLVSNALRNGIYGYKEEFDKLPPAVQRAVGSAEQLHYWATDEFYSEASTRKHVINSYHRAVQAENEMALLPDNVRRLIKSTTAALTQKEGGSQ